MSGLFTKPAHQRDLPLAVRVRPKTLEEFAGQNHILAPGKLLYRLIMGKCITSIILYGPPGTGKTTLAGIIAEKSNSTFSRLSAVWANASDIRRIINEAKNRRAVTGKKTILFVDEIHRFNKAQQDILLPGIEKGTIQFIGATTHNPFFSVISPLISRSHIFQLHPLTPQEISGIIKRGVKNFGGLNISISPDALESWARAADGDARRALNALEAAVESERTGKTAPKDIHISLQTAEESIQKKAVVYDKDEDGHYDTISAYIKSMRGSDPDAALYWLGKMLYAGEDPAFIARRLIICASEDIGNADPQALVIAVSAMHAVEYTGMPEARIPLAQASAYMACAPKSNAAYAAIEKIMKDIETGPVMDVPPHLRDSSYPGAKKLGHGTGYIYSHNGDRHFVEQDYMPKKIRYYTPGNLGYEKKMRQWIEELKKTKYGN